MSLPKTMKAAVLYGPGDMRLVDDYPVPDPGPSEVIIEVKSCAICGTDPDIKERGWPNHPPYGEFVFGHEYSGVIVALGPGVTEFKVGDRVAVETHKGCGICTNCRAGLYTTCLNYGSAEKGHRHFGFTTNGAYADYSLIHVNCVHKLPDDISFDIATLLTTAGTSLYGIRQAGGFEGGETVVISGPGPIGLICVVLARLMGAGTIILTGTRAERLNLGLEFGADVVINVKEENVIERVKALTGGHGADISLECSGSPQATADTIEYTRMSGRIGLLGVHQVPEVAINARWLVLGNFKLSGTRAEGEGSMGKAIALLSKHDVDLSPLITHTFSLDEIHQAFETMEKRLDNAIKVIIKPNPDETLAQEQAQTQDFHSKEIAAG